MLMAPRSSCGTLVGNAMAWPVGIFLVAMVVFIVTSAPAIDSLLRPEPLTLSEAAALRDDGEAVRLILAGYNPSQRYRVRRDFIDARQYVITPLEAAVRIRRVTMVELLLSHGARPDRNTWVLAVCSPQDADTVAVRSALERAALPPASLTCRSRL